MIDYLKSSFVHQDGEFVSKYYREGVNILMNLFDKRSVSCHLLVEMSTGPRDPHKVFILAEHSN